MRRRCSRLLVAGVLMAGMIPFGRAGDQKPKRDPLPRNGAAVEIGKEVAASLIAEILQGLFDSVVSEGKAQVIVTAKTRGPIDGNHPPNDDAGPNQQSDTANNWLESELDAETFVSAPNHGRHTFLEWGHFAHCDLHYQYSDGSWRPNANGEGTYIAGGPRYWHGFAWAGPDGAPEPNVTVVTEAAAAGVFAVNATIEREFRADNQREVRQVLPGNAGGTEAAVLARADSVGAVYFTPEWFTYTLEAAKPGTVRVAPRAGKREHILFHAYAQLPASPQYLFPANVGLDPLTDPMVLDSLYHYADSTAMAVETLPANRADLTIAGAGLVLDAADVPRYKTVGGQQVEKDTYELLADYLADPVAVQIAAPTHAQVGYSPDVVMRQVFRNGPPASDPDVPGELLLQIAPASTPLATKAPSVAFPVGRELVGLAVGVSGTLEDAVTLSARTDGTAVDALLDAHPGDTSFTLAMRVMDQGGASFANRAENRFTPFVAAIRSLIAAGGLDLTDFMDVEWLDREPSGDGPINLLDAVRLVRIAAGIDP